MTDEDDKIIARCMREGIEDTRILTRRFEVLFMDDLGALNMVLVDVYPRATEYIDETIQIV